MASVVLTSGLKLAKKNAGSVSLLYIQAPQYSTGNEKLNLTAWKRGTGGRSSFNGMVATVFGATGFVGRYVCTRLGRTGTQLILPYRGDHYDCMRLKVVGDLGQVLFQPFSIRETETVERAVKYSNVVINLVAREYDTKNFKMEEANVESARTIARACAKAGVDRLIHMSYLNSSEDPEPLAMSTPSRFKKTKWESEKVTMEEFPDATIIKAADIYGSEDRFVKAFAHAWRRQAEFIPLWANGEKTFKQPVYVGDVAQGIINAAKDPFTKGQVYQAVGPKRYKLGELVDWYYRVLRRVEPKGYMRYDMKYDPLFQIRVTMNQKFSPGYPLGYLHWEGLEKEATSDTVDSCLPTLEDLGVELQQMEDHIPWILYPLRQYNYYMEELGEFEKPAPPPVVPI